MEKLGTLTNAGAARTRQGACPLHPIPFVWRAAPLVSRAAQKILQALPAVSVMTLSRFVAKQKGTGVWGLQAPAGPGRARSLLLVVLFAIALPLTAQADEANETRLRDALRQAITQQRSLEDSQAQLQAKLSDQDKQIQALKAQLEQKGPSAQAGQSGQAAVERIAAEANRRMALQNEALTKAGETLEKWKGAYGQAAEVARAKEAERLKLAGQVDGLTKRATSCEAKNTALFKAAGEVLDHLKDISVAEAMAAHEPFVGLKRVELQNLAQTDEDKLLDQKATP